MAAPGRRNNVQRPGREERLYQWQGPLAPRLRQEHVPAPFLCFHSAQMQSPGNSLLLAGVTTHEAAEPKRGLGMVISQVWGLGQFGTQCSALHKKGAQSSSLGGGEQRGRGAYRKCCVRWGWGGRWETIAPPVSRQGVPQTGWGVREGFLRK